MITKYIVGDITKTELKFIAHGVNAQNKMGSGVAKALYEAFPEVKDRYHSFYNECVESFNWKPSDFLGHICRTYSTDKVVFNMFTQERYGYDSNRYVNYAAIVEGFNRLLIW